MEAKSKVVEEFVKTLSRLSRDDLDAITAVWSRMETESAALLQGVGSDGEPPYLCQAREAARNLAAISFAIHDALWERHK